MSRSGQYSGLGEVLLLLACVVALSAGTFLLWRRSCFPNRRLVDLSHPYDNNTVVWPGGQPFIYTQQTAGIVLPENYWYAANDFETAEHCGTHLDAPYHFNENGWKVSDIPIERLITVAAFVNVSAETNGNRSYTLPYTKLVEWEQKNGHFPPNCVIIVSFGWARRYADKADYLGPNKILSFPGVSKEAADWIVAKKTIVGVGVDTASVDQGSDKTIVHKTLHGDNLYHLENLAVSQPLPPLFDLLVMPMKLANGTGAPCRVVGML